jgi:hypothetical protein
MKKYTLLLSILLAAIITNAQVVINYNSHAPQSGDFNSFSEAGFCEPGNNGKNIVWDFSNVDIMAKTTISLQEPVSTEDANKFYIKPNLSVDENGNSFFHELNNSSYSITGFINDDFVISYAAPLTRMLYPFSYTDFIEGELKAEATGINNSKIDISGNYKVVADAFGVIILPGNIRKNVLRITQYSSSVQVSACSEVNIESWKYVWYSSEDRYPIVTSVIQEKRFSSGKIEKTEETWINNKVLNSNLGVENDFSLSGNIIDDVKMDIYPNPFKESAQISFVLTGDATVSLSVYGATGNVIGVLQDNVSAKAGVYSYTLNNKDYNLTPGLYFVQLQVNDKVYIEKLVGNQ